MRMAPYTPDLLRRPMTPCTSSSESSASSSSVANHSAVSPAGAAAANRPAITNGQQIKHQLITNNNNNDHMVLYQQQLNNYLNQEKQRQHPASSSTSTTPADQHQDWKRVKCVIVGDAAVGKTSLIVSYTTNGYPHEYVPTAFDNYTVSVRVDNQPIKLQLCDTAGQDDFDSLRPLCYPNTNVFLVCFSVVNPTSFENLRQRWIPEIRQHSARGTPFILVGTESDLRTNIKVLLDLHRHQAQPVSEREARQLADELGASTYLECSSLTQQNLKETFDAAILVGLEAAALPPPNAAAVESDSRATSIIGRKSLRKLKEKLTTSTTRMSMDSMKNSNLRVSIKNGDVTPTSPVAPPSTSAAAIESPFGQKQQAQVQRPVERHSTHSSASHILSTNNVRGRNQAKKLSTASVPAIGVEHLSTAPNPDGGGLRGEKKSLVNGHLAIRHHSSSDVKSRKGWRKLLCVA